MEISLPTTLSPAMPTVPEVELTPSAANEPVAALTDADAPAAAPASAEAPTAAPADADAPATAVADAGSSIAAVCASRGGAVSGVDAESRDGGASSAAGSSVAGSSTASAVNDEGAVASTTARPVAAGDAGLDTSDTSILTTNMTTMATVATTMTSMMPATPIAAVLVSPRAVAATTGVEQDVRAAVATMLLSLEEQDNPSIAVPNVSPSRGVPPSAPHTVPHTVPPAVPPAVPPTENCTSTPVGLSDAELDVLDVDSQRRGSRRLRRLSGPRQKHPALPPAPARHPSTGWKTHYNPHATWDRSKSFDLLHLHDRWGDPPHRCYLVQWRGRPLELSWVWMENLVDNLEMMRQVDEWKDSGSSSPFMTYRKSKFSGSTASESGVCFLEAILIAISYQGFPDLITLAQWDDFEDNHERILEFGVLRRDATAFFEYLQRKKVPLDYNKLFRKRLVGSFHSILPFQTFVYTLPPGVYITCAADNTLEHCFVIVVESPTSVKVLDGYDSTTTPPYTIQRLEHQEWIDSVRFMLLLEVKPDSTSTSGKHKKRSEKNAAKRLRLQQ